MLLLKSLELIEGKYKDWLNIIGVVVLKDFYFIMHICWLVQTKCNIRYA